MIRYKGIPVVEKKIGNRTAQALFGRIYVPSRIYNELKENNLRPQTATWLEHEVIHIQRQHLVRPIRWYIKYVVSPKFRLNEELIAIEASMKYAKTHNVNFPVEKVAKSLSSFLYLWMVSFPKARTLLYSLWNKQSTR